MSVNQPPISPVINQRNSPDVQELINPIDVNLDSLTEKKKKQYLMQKLSKAPFNALKDRDLIKELDKSIGKTVEKQTMARVNSRVFLSGSQAKDGIKI